jgi:hypothetical protein
MSRRTPLREEASWKLARKVRLNSVDSVDAASIREASVAFQLEI